MAEFVAYFNGEYVPYSEVKIDPDDRGMMGDTVFDIERTFDGKIFRLRDHIDRLYRSLQYSRIDTGLSPDEVEERGGPVCLNSAARFDKWNHAACVRPPRTRQALCQRTGPASFPQGSNGAVRH